jgi:hypothetical protein
MVHVIIPDEAREIRHLNQTGTGPFSFTYDWFQKADIEVFVDDVPLDIDDWSVVASSTIDGGFRGGNITLADSVTAADITISLKTRAGRTSDFAAAGAKPGGVNNELDLLHAVTRDLMTRVDRTIQALPGENLGPLFFGRAADRANKTFKFGADGRSIVWLDASNVETIAGSIGSINSLAALTAEITRLGTIEIVGKIGVLGASAMVVKLDDLGDRTGAIDAIFADFNLGPGSRIAAVANNILLNADSQVLAVGNDLLDVDGVLSTIVTSGGLVDPTSPLNMVGGDLNLGVNSLVRIVGLDLLEGVDSFILRAPGAAIAAAQSETNANLHRAAAAASEYQTAIRRLPGKFADVTAAVAHPFAQVGTAYTGTDDGNYIITQIDPPAAIAASLSLSPEQTSNLSDIPNIRDDADANTATLDALRAAGTAGGTTNAWTYASPAGAEISSLAPRQEFRVIAPFTNTGALTINRDGTGARAVRKYGNVPLVAGDVKAGQVLDLVYDGTVYQIADTSNLNLAALAALAASANQMGYFTGAGAMSLTALTSLARTLLGRSNASQMRGDLGLGALAVLSTIGPGEYSGTHPINKGGTGATDAAGALAALGAQPQFVIVGSNPARISLMIGSAEISIQWGGTTTPVPGNTIGSQNFQKAFNPAYKFVAIGSARSTGTGDGDNVYAFANNQFGMAFVNGVSTSYNFDWIAIGRTE